MKFLDEAKVYIRSGDGGNGCVAFRREKFIEHGGPSGTGQSPRSVHRCGGTRSGECRSDPRLGRVLISSGTP